MPNKDVFIVGGGPSLTGFDFQQLANVNTIAVNVSALDVPNPNYCITADSGIFRKLQQGDFKKVQTTWVLVTNPNHCSMKWRGGQFVQVNSGYVHNLFAANMIIRNAGVEGIGFTFDDFRTGYNSGFCAFQLAVLLGYENIYLLGFDLRSAGTSHYHNKYNGRAISSNDLNKFYNNWAKAIPIVKEETNIKVFSCSKTSRLNRLIRYVPLSRVLGEQEEMTRQEREKIRKENEILISAMSSDSPKLSILICSLENRGKMLRNLLKILERQRNSKVEVLVDIDNKEVTTGAKRNRLLEKAKGKYIAFVDDDDEVAECYIPSILKAIKSNPDCCGLIGRISWKNKGTTKKFIHSRVYTNWFHDKTTYFRCPNHLNPVKREIALKVKFADKTVGEDKDYSFRLKGLLKTEVMIDNDLYFYKTG